ncbi:signal peptidase II [Lachnospiraceae bacterium 50-23]|jgi:lipoprotein signal peptidase|nr:signal peptidase II [Dorea sp.]GFI36322.1 lipoprotein signal peptidase [Lachnospiraceae bacterium]
METKNSRGRYYLTALIWIILGAILDQATKYLAIVNLKGQNPYVIWKGVFQLEYLENRGAAFGLFQNQRLFFFLSVVFVFLAVLWFYSKVPMNRHFLPLRICAVLVMSGAIGNFIDRLRLNYVVDFLYFKLINFPVFNVADIYVTVAAFSFFLLLFFYYKEEDLEQIFHNRK